MSRNISGGRAMDTFMGGLNFQVEHHLFPSVARPNLRKVAPIVRQYCQDLGVRYTATTLVQSYRSVFHYRNRVGRGGLDGGAGPLAAQCTARARAASAAPAPLGRRTPWA